MTTTQSSTPVPRKKRALNPQPTDARRFAELASAFVKDEDFTSAEASAELATACDPRSHEAWVMLGITRSRLKEYERAFPCYVRALELRPDDIASWCDLGELFTLMMDYDRAAAALRQAMILDPSGDHPSGRRARAIVGRTLAMLKKK